MLPGRLITFEGVEGCGKSTQLALLADRLREAGVAVVVTREPGGTALGEALRGLLLDPSHRPLPVAELLMLEAARSQLIGEVILPALERGDWVLSDRFADSSVAYQGEARGLGVDMVEHLNGLACAGIVPDRTLVVELPLAEALHRARGRSTTTDQNRRFEDEEHGFHRAVAIAYRSLAEREPGRVKTIDGRGTVADVHGRVLAAIEDLLP